MWQREDKQLELQAARDAEPIKQLKVERMMWLEQQEKVTTMQSGQCTGGTGEKKKKSHTKPRAGEARNKTGSHPAPAVKLRTAATS